jgi:hypothetical protein
MKRILTLAVAVLALTAALTLTACGRRAERLNGDNTGSTGQPTSAPPAVSSGGSQPLTTKNVDAVTTDLGSVDSALSEVDASLADADKNPEDAD